MMPLKLLALILALLLSPSLAVMVVVDVLAVALLAAVSQPRWVRDLAWRVVGLGDLS